MRIKLLIAALLLGSLAFGVWYGKDHLTTFSGANVWFNLNAPYDLACIGAEYTRGSHQLNSYLAFGVDNCKTN